MRTEPAVGSQNGQEMRLYKIRVVSNLGSDVGNRCRSNLHHPMDASVTRAGSLGFFLDRTWGGEYMFIRLTKHGQHVVLETEI